jgi:hypothetical protein
LPGNLRKLLFSGTIYSIPSGLSIKIYRSP